MALLVSVAGCGSEEPSLAASASIDEVVGALACQKTAVIDPMEAPTRGRAATSGVACQVDGAEVHVFARAPINEVDEALEPCTTVASPTNSPTTACAEPGSFARGGTMGRIAFLVGIGLDGAPECAMWILVADGWFVLADDQDVLTSLEAEVGGDTEPIVPAAPPASYPGPGCPISN